MIVITVARKPLVGSVANNVSLYGTGAINLDSCRIPTGEEELHASTTILPVYGKRSYNQSKTCVLPFTQHPNGRWPANIVIQHSDHSDKNVLCPCQEIDQQGEEPLGISRFFKCFGGQI